MDVQKLFRIINNKIDFFSGVPDSLLSSLSKILTQKKTKHFIAANEGNAIAHGVGYYLAKNYYVCIFKTLV